MSFPSLKDQQPTLLLSIWQQTGSTIINQAMAPYTMYWRMSVALGKRRKV